MPFTATINTITFANEQFHVGVTFNDSATSFTTKKEYVFNADTTSAQAVAQITADGEALKANLNKNANLQSRIGHVITIDQ